VLNVYNLNVFITVFYHYMNFSDQGVLLYSTTIFVFYSIVLSLICFFFFHSQSEMVGISLLVPCTTCSYQ